MRNKVYYILLFLSVYLAGVKAQNKPISLEDIWASGTFYPERMTHLSAMKNTNRYTVVEASGKQIGVYDFATLQKIKTLFDANQFPEVAQIHSYTFDKTENQILIATRSESIYRRSFLADYFVYNITTNQLRKVSNKKIQEPVFSPDGKRIAFGYQNNLYIYSLEDGNEIQITSDGKRNEIINGITDWVYEEEFSFVRAFDWNADGTKLAFLRFNEKDVPEFSMDIYANELYPQQQVFKYPKAGEKNAEVSLHLYDVALNQQREIGIGAYYIPRLQWTNDANFLSVQTLNRHQNDFNLILVDARNFSFKSVLNEKSNTYVDVSDNLRFLSDNSFLFTSEKDGFNHIYHYDKNCKLKKQITQGKWEVTQFYGHDPRSGRIFYQSTENGSINRGVYSILLSGKNKKQLSVNVGTNNATFSPDYTLYINQFSSVNKPPHYTLNESSSGKEVKDIVNNSAYIKRISAYDIPKKEFLELSINGEKLNTYLIKPTDFDPKKQYPLLMYQYSGPGSQEVKNAWLNSNDFWHMHLVQQGYIVACVDGRGTGYKGNDFKKCTYKELGKYEVQDQIDTAKLLASYPYIDANRVGIWGWSFGGFMSSNCIFQAGDIFKTAIAVAPVTSWRFYDTIYTERFMQTPQENPSGYDNNSPITHAKKLKGNYLLIHGTADDNVHVQNAMVLINQLVHLNKRFDWLIYPDKDHGIYGGYTRLQLYQKMTDYLLEKL
ncbi:S9 family peptidase [Capnocytophaga sp.]|uniref:S9 family peptidase n=1 Tax=Capnocytophaga sp. TaxID=44737 RepID=UPI0026DC913D|nr:S9 family peptidase [Capnocytophaga sp.]MDO5104411.1 S9 family peptidase [Capnocytophaga sp.]